MQWCSRVIDSITLETYHVGTPIISAPDVTTAAKILIFQVKWLFTHNVQGDSDAAQSAFRNGLFDHLRLRGRVCNLSSLLRLLKHAQSLNIRVYVLCLKPVHVCGLTCPLRGSGLGVGVERSVLRAAIDLVVGDEMC